MIEQKPQKPEEVLRQVWQFHIAEAVKRPTLARAILEKGQRLAWRFVHFYRRLWKQPRRTRRFLQLKVAGTIAGVALFMALSGTPAYAATITVDGTTCTLVDAIESANEDMAIGGCATGSGADVIMMPANQTFTYTIYDNDYAGYNALPVVSSEITIEGNGSTIEAGILPTGEGSPYMRAFANSFEGDLTINDLTITNFVSDNRGGAIYNYVGALEINDSTITGNSSNEIGGGIYNFNGNVTLNNTEVTNNSSHFLGGGIGTGSFALPPENGFKYASLTINESEISGNTVYITSSFSGGGGIASFGIKYGQSDVVINNSEISDNEHYYSPNFVNGDVHTVSFGDRATIEINQANQFESPEGGGEGFGGGVFSWSAKYGVADTEITDSTISGNVAGFLGGGVGSLNKYASGTTTIDGSTITENYASTVGGGVGMATLYYDGDYGYLEITNSTISGNAGAFGGGIGVYSIYFGGPGAQPDRGSNGGYDEVTVSDSTITGNDAYVGGGFYNFNAFASMERTIVSGNTANYYNAGYTYYYSPTTTTDNYNLFGEDGDAGLGGAIYAEASDIVPGSGVTIDDILFTTLANTGGPTETHLLMSMGLATDAIPAGLCGPGVDQRDLPRPSGAGCDIGSVELQPPTDVALTDFGGQSTGGNIGLVATALTALGLSGWLARRRLRQQEM